MFGLGFGEIVVLVVVLLLVVGPRELPKMLRSLGQGARKIKRMSNELREQSGIDEIIHDEGLDDLRGELDELRSIARPRNVLDTLVRPAPGRRIIRGDSNRSPERDDKPGRDLPGREPPSDVEYPEVGCDSYGALSDMADPYQPGDDGVIAGGPSRTAETIPHEDDVQQPEPARSAGSGSEAAP